MLSIVFFGYLKDVIKCNIKQPTMFSKMHNSRIDFCCLRILIYVRFDFRRIRQLADRSDYFRSELRSPHYQTWFLPNDQAFASITSSLSFLLDQTSINNTHDINEVNCNIFV